MNYMIKWNYIILNNNDDASDKTPNNLIVINKSENYHTVNVYIVSMVLTKFSTSDIESFNNKNVDNKNVFNNVTTFKKW